METTWYYRTVARVKHPEVLQDWIEAVLASPLHTEEQPDGRLRYYGYVQEAQTHLRVIVENGAVHNAFLDRTAQRKLSRE